MTVTADAECVWNATADVPWITGLTPATGQGPGQIQFQVIANGSASRQGGVTVNGQRVQLTQAAGGPNTCSASLSSSSQNVSSSGGSGSFAVTTAAGCAWTASPGASWVQITSGSSGTGPGNVAFSVQSNAGATRSTSISVLDQTFQVAQSSGLPSCTFAVSPGSQALGPSGGSASFALNVNDASCAWTATSNVPWMTFTSPASGSGSATISVSATANSGAARVGAVSVGGQTFTLNEGGSCATSIAPSGQAFAAAGGAGTTITVTTAAGCAWSTTTSDTWITITSGASGTGPGTAKFSVAANNGPARTGTLFVAGQPFTVDQANGCTFAINPTSQSVGAGGATGVSVNVTSVTGCGWSSSSNASWLTITSGATGSGSDAVTFDAAASTGPPRSGTLTIAGQTLTVNQASGCTFGINPTSQAMPAGGGAGSPVAVTTAAGCAWSATAVDSWLTITAGASGSGNGSVSFSATANNGAPRTGTLTIAGQTFSVNQASGCAYSLNPTTQSAPATSGTGTSVAVTTVNGCAWTATTADTWITITSGASGSGNGSVAFTYTANTGPARTGTLNIAGSTSTVNQANGCTFALNPTSVSVGKTATTSSTAVTAGTGCSWTATTTDSWITITSGSSGSGNGTVNFSIAANLGNARTGTITIGGQTFTVSQAKGN